MAANEAATIDHVERYFELFRQHCATYGGEFIKTTGDGVLLLFESASAAIDYAMTLQERIRAMPQEPPFVARFRIGVHMGEVRRRGDDVYGHAVNLAARLEEKAKPGGVCVTHEVYRAAQSSTPYGFHFGGRVALKNIPEPVAIYHLVGTGDADAKQLAPRLLISVIDGVSLSTERREPIKIRSTVARALVGYLALSSNRSGEALDRVAALIWPGRKASEARHALIGCVRTLERALAPHLHEGLLRRGEVVGFEPSRTEVDLLRILSDLDDGKVDELLLARSDWPDAILRGLEHVSPLFHAWLSVARHNWRERVCEALEANLERFAPTEPALRRAATALLLLEPSHEHAAQQLIRHYSGVGNFAAAMRAYDGLRKVMQERFSLAPSAETDELIRKLSIAAPAAQAGSLHTVRRTRPPSVAVARFDAQGDALNHAATGFRADLIANLSKFRELTIIETPSAAESAGLDYVLTAECMDGHEKVRLFVKLSDPRSNRIVWSDSFPLTLSGWSKAQQRIVSKVASSLEIYLSQDRLSRTLLRPIADLDTYDVWLRGEQLLTLWSPSAEDEAAALFRRVIAEDPEFAPAYASLASVYNSRHLILPGSVPTATPLAALELAERAVALDPLDARNHLVIAWTTALLRRFEQSEVHYELAAGLNPNNPKTLVSAALGLAFVGRKEASAQMLERAMALTPLFLDYQWSHIATIRYFNGDMEGTVQAADRSKNVIIDTPGWKAAALARLGRPAEASAALAQLYEIVTAAWGGRRLPTHAEILDWFASAFPVRHKDDMVLLGKALHDLESDEPRKPAALGSAAPAAR